MNTELTSISHQLLTSTKPKTLTIAIGSLNPAKVKSVETTFQKILKTTDPNQNITLNLIKISAKSNVSDQPYGDTETRTGSINRAYNAYKEASLSNPNTTIDFSVGLEGGVIDNGEDYVSDLPGGDEEIEEGGAGCRPMWCMAWMAVYCPGEVTQRRR